MLDNREFTFSEQFWFEVFSDSYAFLPHLTVHETDRDILKTLFSWTPYLSEIRAILCILCASPFLSHRRPSARRLIVSSSEHFS